MRPSPTALAGNCPPSLYRHVSFATDSHRGHSSTAPQVAWNSRIIRRCIIRPHRMHGVQRCGLLLQPRRGLSACFCRCICPPDTSVSPTVERMNRARRRAQTSAFCPADWSNESLSISRFVRHAADQGCSPKKEVGGRLKQDLDRDF